MTDQLHHTPDPLLLVGDIGGTKTDLAVVSLTGGPRHRIAEQRYASRDFGGLEPMVLEFLAEVELEVEAACFDVAGPVVDGEAQLTNLGWRLCEPDLARAAGARSAWLLNDLVATAAAVPLLRREELQVIQAGTATPGGAIAVLAPGTGLGEAFLTFDGTTYRPQPSEGGHSAFAPASEVQLDLLRHLWRRFDHVSFERVASGIGVPNLYDFLRERHGAAEAPAPTEAPDRTRLIIDAALHPTEPDPVAQAAVELFLGILGTEAANLALKVLATGGVYLAGGIAQRLCDRIPQSGFLESMRASGRFRSTLERVPVYVVSGTVALLGAAGEGLRRLAAERVAIGLPGEPFVRTGKR